MSYGCPNKVCQALKKLESLSAIASCDSYASFVLSNLPRASTTQKCVLWRLPFVNCPIPQNRKAEYIPLSEEFFLNKRRKSEAGTWAQGNNTRQSASTYSRYSRISLNGHSRKRTALLTAGSELHASPHIHIWMRRSIYGCIWIRQYGNVL